MTCRNLTGTCLTLTAMSAKPASATVRLPPPPHRTRDFRLSSHPIALVLLLAAVVFPNNGSHTSIFKSCFATVDEVCASDRAESHSFCRAILREPDPEDYPREPGDEHGMMHVVEVCGRAALRYV